jgi:hypothetical protein
MNIETHLAVVMANDTDPEKEYGIEVQADSLVTDETYPHLAKPWFPPNQIKVPEVGQQVEIVVIGDNTDDEPGDAELGITEFPEFIYWKTRIFDSEKGKIPAELKASYPRRSGWWMEDGSIIYIDDGRKDKDGNPGTKEILIKLSNGNTKIQLLEDTLTLTVGSNIIEVKAGSVKFGSTTAAEAIMLGNIVKAAFTTLVGGWLTNLFALQGSADPASALYGTNQHATVTTFQGTLANWLSTKHFVDS